MIYSAVHKPGRVDVPGAAPVILPPRTAWMDGESVNEDRLKAYIGTLTDRVTHFVYDIELPKVMPFDVRLSSADKVKAAADVAIKLVRVFKRERPDVAVSMYDAFIEDATACYNATTARHRQFISVDQYDTHFKNQSVASQIAVAGVELANDFLAPLHNELDFICSRAYFPLNWSEHPRRMLIRWVNREGHRIARGKPVLMLYKPNTQSGDQRSEHGAIEMAQDAAAMHDERVPDVCLWRDQFTKLAALAEFATVLNG